MKNSANSGRRRLSPTRIATACLAVAGLSAGAIGLASASSGPSAKAISHTGAITISTVKNAKFGTILVSGTTVYTLKASSVACTATCLKTWPEVLLPKGTTKATAGTGVNALKLGTIKRANSRLQVTYGGKPLYWFVKDLTAKDVKGVVSDKWGKWNVYITVKLTTGTTTTTSGGGGGIGF
jgi:predicted lipoprotein with Yx(FWY)xxD motif